MPTLTTNSTEQLQLSNATILPTGLILNEQTTFDQWRDMATAFSTMQGGLLWWIGDYFVFGESKYGDKYKEAVAATGYSYGTLANAVYVSAKVKLHARRENLSYAHHAEVAALDPDDQSRWLDAAETEKLDRSELRASIKAGKVIRKSDFQQPEPLNLPVAAVHYRNWHNKVFSERLQTWGKEDLERVAGYLQPFAADYAAATKRLEELG